MKYFNIAADEHTLASAEALGESITRLEEAVGNLKGREEAVTQQVSPPRFIQKHYHDEFLTRVGVHLMPVVVPYPVYKFEYVSAGGNSSQRTTLTLDRPTIDVLIETLGNKIRFARTVAGQRKLMTREVANRRHDSADLDPAPGRWIFLHGCTATAGGRHQVAGAERRCAGGLRADGGTECHASRARGIQR
jgi:hypothetical protein